VNIAANEGSQITQANQGIELSDSTGAIAISGFEILNTDDSGISGTDLSNVTLTNNRIEGATNQGIFLENVNEEVNITDNIISETIDNNTVLPLTGQGILLNNVTGRIEISTNTISGTMGFKPDPQIPPSGQGIVINNDTGSVNITLSNNSLFDNYEDAILIGLGVPFGDPIVNLRIEGNTIENNGGSNPTRGDGIGIGMENNALIENLTISGNTLIGNFDDGIDIRMGENFPNATAQIQQAIIENNEILDHIQQGINIELFNQTAIFMNVVSNIINNNSTDVIVQPNTTEGICLYFSENSNTATMNLNGITPNNSPCF